MFFAREDVSSNLLCINDADRLNRRAADLRNKIMTKLKT